MVTKQQIEQAAKERYARKGYTRDAFIAGAQWANENEQQWHNPAKEQPEIGEQVLAITAGGSQTVLRYDGRYFTRTFGMNITMRDGGSTEIKYEQTFRSVIAWMPIPKYNAL